MMRTDTYILKDGVPVPEPDIDAWSEWKFGNPENCRVALTQIDDVEISTVFTSVDYNFRRGGDPILYETMIFGGEHDQYQERYHTLEESMLGHERAVALVRGEKAHDE